MNKIKLLDVTLRDGGNRIDFHFSYDNLQKILVPLDNSGIEYIEIGYRNGAIHPLADLGIVGLCNRDYLLFCRELVQKASMAIMLHPKNVTQADLVELRDCGISLVRICVVRGGLRAACPLITAIQQLGMKVSVNFIHMSQYSEQELDAVVAQVYQYSPDMIYFADSNGSSQPFMVHSIYEKYTKKYTIPFGFHAHDNLGLAQANTLAAVSAGTQYVDVALAGMGKGIGNLRTEFFIAYLHALQNKKYELDAVLSAANYIRRTFNTEHDPIDRDEFTRGIFDLSTAQMKTFNR